MSRRSHHLRFWGSALAVVPIVACATSGGPNAFGSGKGSGGGGGGGSSGAGGGDGGGSFFDDSGAASDQRSTRPQRCDDAGRCTCFNVASIGLPGHTGFQGGTNGADSTSAFTDWLNTESSTNVDLITKRPAFTADFLAKYDVLIIQWLVDGVSGSTGTAYWNFSADELAALKGWVLGGGGIITLSGYDSSAQEVTPLNEIVQAVSDMSYGTADVLGTVSTSNYCLGESDPLPGWVQTTPIGKHIMEVGAFHGRPIMPGKATVDCSDNMYVYAAHEDVGQGHVFAYADEWVTYTSQWFGIDAGASCVNMSPAVTYQVPQFWYNAITYASQATQCPFMLNGAIR